MSWGLADMVEHAITGRVSSWYDDGGGYDGYGSSKSWGSGSASSGKKRKWNDWEDEGSKTTWKPVEHLFGWISCGEGSALASEGYAMEGAAVKFDKSNPAMSAAHWALQELVDDVKEDVTFTDDPDLQTYPELGQVISRQGFGPDLGVCVAVSAKYMRYGVGLAFGWKDRERAAKLALALSIAAGTSQLMHLCSQVEEMGPFCKEQSVEGKIRGQLSQPRGLQGKPAPKPASAAAAAVGEGDAAGPGNYPVLGLSVPAGTEFLKDGMSEAAPAVYFDKQWTEAFSTASWLLSHLSDHAEVTIDHDADVEKYPEIAAAVKLAGGQDDCVALITCPDKCKWAVGLASGWKTRERAAKMALALTFIEDEQTVINCANDFDGFGVFAQAAGLMPPGYTAAKKKRIEKPQQNDDWGFGGYPAFGKGKGKGKGFKTRTPPEMMGW
eukprot:TRINITY_DN5739_c0_g1_i1.p1 TRINITY_DN5739_c0_g1~~TRINITY_DN5739_c0_g1_i1.p1  ORF type:complete len:439 (+),score=134.86 TRINITY_DN5739_c0_g1_i1:89-1405(+)